MSAPASRSPRTALASMRSRLSRGSRQWEEGVSHCKTCMYSPVQHTFQTHSRVQISQVYMLRLSPTPSSAIKCCQNAPDAYQTHRYSSTQNVELVLRCTCLLYWACNQPTTFPHFERRQSICCGWRARHRGRISRSDGNVGTFAAPWRRHTELVCRAVYK